MTKASRQLLLIIIFCGLIIGTAASGYLYWDAVAIGGLALLVWIKKLFTLQGIILLAKKLPLLLFAGGKKIVVKVLGGLLLFSARTRFRLVKRIIVEVKLIARYLSRKLRYHWADMDLWEKALVAVTAIPATLALASIFLMLAFIPQSIRGLFIRKAQESTAASVIDQVLPKEAKKRADAIHSATKEVIRDKLSPSFEDQIADPTAKDKPSLGASDHSKEIG